jgi:hypothetical protein
MTYRVGSIGEFMRWTKRVVADPASAGNMPKRWFDSNATAKGALATQPVSKDHPPGGSDGQGA